MKDCRLLAKELCLEAVESRNGFRQAGNAGKAAEHVEKKSRVVVQNMPIKCGAGDYWF